MGKRVIQQFAIIGTDGQKRPLVLVGRNAWALSELVKAGPDGCTPFDNPGPRWSGYIHNLRRFGLHIVTHDEHHTGPYAGTHARYVLHDRVEVVGIGECV